LVEKSGGVMGDDIISWKYRISENDNEDDDRRSMRNVIISIIFCIILIIFTSFDAWIDSTHRITLIPAIIFIAVIFAFMVHMSYPYWEIVVKSDSEKIGFNTRPRIKFLPPKMVEFSFGRKLEIEYSKRYNALQFSQGDRKVALFLRGMEKADVEKLIVLLKAKKNVSLMIDETDILDDLSKRYRA
jgi:hypothetical protein